MKKFKLLCVAMVLFTIFSGCQKEEPAIPEKEKLSDNPKELFLEDTLEFSKVVTVYDEDKLNSVVLKISSNNKKLLDSYLSSNKHKLVLLAQSDIAEKNMISSINDADIKKVNPDYVPSDCIMTEVLEENMKIENSSYTIKNEFSSLKSYPYPPNTYYFFHKYPTNMNGKLLYYPDDTNNDELLYKWGYTESWIQSWHFDDYWRYLYGFDAVDSPMTFYHPYNYMGYYRLGIAIYYDDPDCWDVIRM